MDSVSWVQYIFYFHKKRFFQCGRQTKIFCKKVRQKRCFKERERERERERVREWDCATFNNFDTSDSLVVIRAKGKRTTLKSLKTNKFKFNFFINLWNRNKFNFFIKIKILVNNSDPSMILILIFNNRDTKHTVSIVFRN